MAHRLPFQRVPSLDYPRVGEKVPNLAPTELNHLNWLAKLQVFRLVLRLPDHLEVFLSGNPRLAHVRHYLPDSAKVKPADGNEVSPVAPGLSLNPRKSQFLCRRRLARLDSNLCCVPDFAEQVLMHAVKAGLTETQMDHYKVCWLWTCQDFEDLIPRYERDVPVHGLFSMTIFTA